MVFKKFWGDLDGTYQQKKRKTKGSKSVGGLMVQFNAMADEGDLDKWTQFHGVMLD